MLRLLKKGAFIIGKKHFTPTEFLESWLMRSYKHLTPNGV